MMIKITVKWLKWKELLSMDFTSWRQSWKYFDAHARTAKFAPTKLSEQSITMLFNLWKYCILRKIIFASVSIFVAFPMSSLSRNIFPKLNWYSCRHLANVTKRPSGTLTKPVYASSTTSFQTSLGKLEETLKKKILYFTCITLPDKYYILLWQSPRFGKLPSIWSDTRQIIALCMLTETSFDCKRKSMCRFVNRIWLIWVRIYELMMNLNIC